jgi:hypothetical protein
MDAVSPKPRWYRLSPDRVVVGLLIVEFLLWLSDWIRWPAWHKGYAVLAAVGVSGAGIILLMLWWLAAIVFGLKFQFSIRGLLLLVVAVALPCAWLKTAVNRARWQSDVLAHIRERGGVHFEYDSPIATGQDGIYEAMREIERDLGQVPSNPTLRERIRDRLGEDFFYDVVGVVFLYRATNDADLDGLPALPRLRRLVVMENARIGSAIDDEVRDDRPHPKSQFGEFTNDGVRRLVRFKDVRELTITGAKITDEALEPIIAATQLETLDVGSTEINLAELKNFGRLSQLTELKLAETNVTDAGLARIASLSRLQSLALAYTHITDDGLKNLNRLTELQTLELDGTSIGDAGLEHVAKLTSLVELTLAETKVTDAGLKNLTGLQGLTSLILYKTVVTDAGVEELQKLLPNCKIEH